MLTSFEQRTFADLMKNPEMKRLSWAFQVGCETNDMSLQERETESILGSHVTAEADCSDMTTNIRNQKTQRTESLLEPLEGASSG